MITVEHLTKKYDSFTAVDDISFAIGEGHIYGFLGPNGAGKSTTMNILTGCLSATAGEVKIDGYDIFEDGKMAKKRIGYLPELPPLYMEETPKEYLTFVARAKGIAKQEVEHEVSRVMEETKIQQMQNRLIKHLSKGYRQRVGIAQALLGNPQYIILDEPTVGLDPIQIIEIRELIRELGVKHTVILSSHILSEVQAMCDSVLIIAHGKIVAFDTPENLEKALQVTNEIDLWVESEPAVTSDILSGIEEIQSCEYKEADSGSRVKLTVNTDNITEVCKAIFYAFASAQRAILQMTPQKADLEDIFLELTEDNADHLAEVSESKMVEETLEREAEREEE